MNKKINSIKLFSILCIIVYILFIGDKFIQQIPGYRFVYDLGKQSALEDNGKIEAEDMALSNIFFVNLSTKSQFFPEEGGEAKNGDQITYAKEKIRVAIKTSEDTIMQKMNFKYLIGVGILNQLVAIIFIIMPFIAYLIISKMNKGIIFDKNNVKNLRILAFLFLVVVLIEKISATISYYQQINLLNFENYEIQPDRLNLGFLLISIVIFIISIAFQKGLKIKEENDLMI